MAEIEFAPWQCIAELVDNSFDEFLEIDREGGADALEVGVQLPTTQTGKIVVQDNGRGMALSQVRDAVRAGFSANDPFSKLGLFGMGFNVATARLGDVTTFVSTREGDTEWVGVQLDLRQMSDDFSAPVVRLAKSDRKVHGTRITVERLNAVGKHFCRATNRTRLREQLGGVYAYLLEDRQYGLNVDGIEVKPWRHCIWSTERKVVRGREDISAVIEIDESLTPQTVCRACGAWQEPGTQKCSVCESTDVIERERRVWGWLGIAREIDSKQFGIDFLRNGRKVLRLDKSLFEWADPDDPSGAPTIEYPIELPANQGRIVGEIHLDHVPVLYTKDNFDRSDRSWHTAVRIIRGETSLLPRTAKKAGDEPNDSPLARLHRGFRRNDPGVAYLMAGDGMKRKDTSHWVELFYKGDAAYQTDEKWWEAAVEHDRIAPELKAQRERERRRKLKGATEEDEDPTKEFGERPTTEPEPEEPERRPEKKLSEAERIEQLIAAGRVMPELRAEYHARNIPGRPISLEAIALIGTEVRTGDGTRTPVLMVGRPKGAFLALVDLDHSLFEHFDDDPADLVLMALAQQMLVRSKADVPIGTVFAELKDHYLSARAIDPTRLQPEANQTLLDIQQRMVACVASDPRRPWNDALAEHERGFTQERIVTTLRIGDIEPVLDSGEYLTLMPPSAVPRVVSDWPDAFMDGKLFNEPYADIAPPVRTQVLARLTGYLNDAAWLASAPVAASREELARARLSLQLLPDEIVAAGP